MRKAEQKEIMVKHKTGNVGIRVYKSNSVYCHWHDEFEFILPVSSECRCIVNSKSIIVNPGQALLVFPEELHAVLNSEDYFYAIVFHPNIISGEELEAYVYPHMDYSRFYDVTDDKCKEIVEALNKICFIYDEAKAGLELMLKGMIIQIAGLIFRNGLFSPMKISEQKSDVFCGVLDFVNTNLSDKLTLDYVASSVNFSRSYISRLFRQNTGNSFCEYVTDVRIETAKKRILTTSDSILDIALSCGFENVSYFDKIFKKKTGMTPVKFRYSNVLFDQ